LSVAKTSLHEDNGELLRQNKTACEELVNWRTRAEAAELELKSLGRLAVSQQEKDSLVFARLLESKVVGIEASEAPLGLSVDVDIVDVDSVDMSASTRMSPTKRADAKSPYTTRRENAQRTVVTSQDILNTAWEAQKALAIRLDEDLAVTERNFEMSMFGLQDVDRKIQKLTGYVPPRAWTTKR